MHERPFGELYVASRGLCIGFFGNFVPFSAKKGKKIPVCPPDSNEELHGARFITVIPEVTISERSRLA